ncbi:MAG: PIG-L family deacetylase [Deltaproteobacteria bacterium]|nr:PIG-L family deacetylase [Deltaproteobacteria bacterium]
MKILIVAAHPDDEVLGCGATIAKHTKTGDEVHVAIFAEGVTSRDEKRSREKRNTDLSQHFANEVKCPSAYKSEMEPCPHARSLKAVEHLARWMGASVGMEEAEAFSLGRVLG